MTDIEHEFTRITRQRYSAMVTRFAPQYDKLGRLAKLGYTVPFNLAEYRAWYRHKLHGNLNGTAECEYCGANLHMYAMQTEHRLPPVQGGSMDLSNLCAACDQCNQQKGEMSDTAFIVLRKLITNRLTVDDILTRDDEDRDIPVLNFTDIDRTDLLGRLQRCLRLTIKSQKRQKVDAAVRREQEAQEWERNAQPTR
jgi:hypothetical protein